MDVDVDVDMDVDKHTDATKNEPFRVTIRNACTRDGAFLLG